MFVQTRWKPHTSASYLGVLELPAGGIDGYENVYDAVAREVKEETNLDVVRFIDDEHIPPMTNRPGDTAIAFKPFICQQVLETDGGLPWVGFVFRCEVKGKIDMESTEARDPQWLTIDELDEIVTKTPEKVFILQLAALRYYVDTIKSQA